MLYLYVLMSISLQIMAVKFIFHASPQVPKGHVWLEGDNATNSTDSRCYGPVPAALIRGRVVWKVMP